MTPTGIETTRVAEVVGGAECILEGMPPGVEAACEGEPGLGNTGLDVVRTAAPLDVAGPTATVRLQPYEIGTWLVRLA